MIGRPFGNGAIRGKIELGIGLFLDERGSTTVAAAVAIMVSLALVFGAATAQWVSSRSADVQAVADAGALAGMNIVAGYATTAQLLDAIVLSMGLVGMITLATGVVVSAIPVADVAGPPILKAAKTVLDARKTFAMTAAKGLKKLEEAVPYLAAANSFLTVRGNCGADGSYVGIAVPFPHEGSSDFGELLSEDIAPDVEEAASKGEEIDELSRQMEQARKRADDALERGWRADCAPQMCLRERAQTLAGLSGQSNPEYPTPLGWDFGVAVLRARAYYAQRIAQETPADSSVEELTRSCARKAFYAYALELVQSSYCSYNEDGTATLVLNELPGNTGEVRATSLYTDAVWYCTQQEGARTIHSSSACPGATGPSAGFASVADEESGMCRECPVCRFTVVDIGRAPAASTSIENGFEHYWREIVRASRDYASALEELAEYEQQAKEASESAVDAYKGALERLKANRVKLDPPGKYGCVCVVADLRAHQSPAALAGPFSGTAVMPARAAVSASVLARDASSNADTVLGGFFDALVARGGLLAPVTGALDAVMSAWGGLLTSYGSGYDAFMSGVRSSFERLSDLGMGRLSEWLEGQLKSVIELTGIAPADLSVKRPVLANTNSVMQKTGNDRYVAAHSIVQSIQTVGEGAGPRQLLEALGFFLQEYQGSTKITVAEFEMPGTGVTVPIEVDVAQLAGVGEAA